MISYAVAADAMSVDRGVLRCCWAAVSAQKSLYICYVHRIQTMCVPYGHHQNPHSHRRTCTRFRCSRREGNDDDDVINAMMSLAREVEVGRIFKSRNASRNCVFFKCGTAAQHYAQFGSQTENVNVCVYIFEKKNGRRDHGNTPRSLAVS